MITYSMIQYATEISSHKQGGELTNLLLHSVKLDNNYVLVVIYQYPLFGSIHYLLISQNLWREITSLAENLIDRDLLSTKIFF